MPKCRPCRIFLAAILFAAAWLPGPAAFAWCAPPSHYGNAPLAPTYLSEPKPPDCLSARGYARRHRCADWEYNSYVNALGRFIREMTDYAKAARAFADRAAAYADDAAAYADCATKDARAEID
jgi:hypothetical protein